MITIGDAEQDGWDPDGGRWYTLCEDHAQIINHDTLALAREWATTPTMWCATCQHEHVHTIKPDWACTACDEAKAIA